MKHGNTFRYNNTTWAERHAEAIAVGLIIVGQILVLALLVMTK